MKTQMVFNKAGDKIVAVIVAGLNTQLEFGAAALACCLQRFGL